MKKLVLGILEFRRTKLLDYRARFSRLALEQRPDSLFVCCSDSRVAPNAFASTDPGDLFVIRNVGNLIPNCGVDGRTHSDESEAAAIEFALENLNVSDIIVCGHSNCGAMQAIFAGPEKVQWPNLRSWLRHGETAKKWLEQGNPALDPTPHLADVNRLSQLNVLAQIEHLRSYPSVLQKIMAGKIRIHGWWFELGGADVYAYEALERKFVLMDESEVDQIIRRLSAT